MSTWPPLVVQTGVSAVQGRLPEDVGAPVWRSASLSQFVLAIGIGCRDNRYDSQFISNYCDVYVKDALKRVRGVGDAQIFGERKYSMRGLARSAKIGESKH